MTKLSVTTPVNPFNKNKKRRFKAKKNKQNKIEGGNEEKNEEKNSKTLVKGDDKLENEITEPIIISKEIAEKYPVLKNQDLVNKFLGVTMTNNQKGRIRQQLKDNLKGTSEVLLPEVIHNRIQAIVKDIITLTDAELRKIRILYNMLKTSIQTPAKVQKKKKNKKKKKSKDKVNENKDSSDKVKDENIDLNEEDKVIKDNVKKEIKESKDESKKLKGPKRYVVFVGNLPLDIDKERIMHHFYEIREQIIDVRVQKPAEGKKSCIAYVELKNEPSFELALSKHHSMMENRRINVLYTVQQNSKISKTEAKGKAAKLVALQKSGKLMGSVPLNKKRSQRRMKAKKARAKLEAES